MSVDTLFLLTDLLVHLDKKKSSGKFSFFLFTAQVGRFYRTGIYFLVRESLNIQIVFSNPGGNMDVCLHLSVLRSFV
jgi:hypothetical protein